MSTSIRNGFRITNANGGYPSIQDLLNFVEQFRPFVKQKAEAMLDQYMDQGGSWLEFSARQDTIKSTGRRDPDIDTGFEVAFFPLADKVIGIVYSERTNWIKHWMAQPGISDYAYWDHTDGPAGISKAEWDTRGDDWSNAVGVVPSMTGFSIQISSPAGPMPRHFRVAQQPKPPLPSVDLQSSVTQKLAALEEEKRQAKAIVTSQCGNKGSASILRWALKMQFEENAIKDKRIAELECAPAASASGVSCNENPRLFSMEEIARLMPVLLSDLKHESAIDQRDCTNANIRRALRAHVVRNLFSDERFKYIEPVAGTGQEGLFIKGYVRDVWDYLGKANSLIDDTDFEAEFASEIRIELLERSAYYATIDETLQDLRQKRTKKNP